MVAARIDAIDTAHIRYGITKINCERAILPNISPPCNPPSKTANRAPIAMPAKIVPMDKLDNIPANI